jgi:hypothetical protein
MPFITLSNFVKEHKQLIPTLLKGSKKARVKEAKDQMKELKRVIKKGI